MNRIIATCAVAVTAAASALLVPAVAQTASAAPETGVWSQTPGGAPTGAVASNGTFSGNGLWVSGTAAGEQAVSAVRFAVDPQETATELRIRVAKKEAGSSLAFVLCGAKNAWKPPATRPGPFAERAIADCEVRKITGTASPDGKSVVFPLADFAPGADVDLVLTRTPGDQSLLDVKFELPEAADLQVTVSEKPGGASDFSGGGATGDRGGGSATSSAFDGSSATADDAGNAPAPPSFGGGLAGGSIGSTGSGGSFSIPSASTSFEPASPSVPAIAESAVIAPATPDVPQVTLAVPSSASTPDSWDSSRWAALIALIGLTAWMVAIVAQRSRSGGGPKEPTFTIYRGVPPS